jgi:hypothetical protein
MREAIEQFAANFLVNTRDPKDASPTTSPVMVTYDRRAFAILCDVIQRAGEISPFNVAHALLIVQTTLLTDPAIRDEHNHLEDE